MDWINKMYMISEKLKNQMHSKGIDSLDKVFMAISKFDKEGKNYVEKIYFENFLATIGIFLKTQELSELHKFLYTAENDNKVFFEAFINILKVFFCNI
jgi:Ca2+-binding EF-hand superfamily protein